MMKWRVRRDSSIEPEDIRHSLEILDSVLAEFEECLESVDINQFWDSVAQSHRISHFLSSEDNSNGDNDVDPVDPKLFFLKNGKDGSPSHEEQARVCSLPKRSPATGSDVCEQNLNPSDDGLSHHSQISSLSQQKSGDTAPRRSVQKNIFDVEDCELERTSLVMELTDIPFQQRKQIWKRNVADESFVLPHSTGGNNSDGSSFWGRKTPISDNSSEPASLPNSLSGGNENGISLSSTPHTSKCTCREKIQRLNAKFSETRRLLKQNSIHGLDLRPPSFVPTPPILNRKTNSIPHSDISVETPRKLDGSSAFLLQVKDSFLESEMDSCSSVNSSNKSLQSEDSPSQWTSRLCNSSLPNLLPTDALHRPQLGLSYSLEDDLSPGLKEIQQSSTPKTENSSPTTFSHSASSLELHKFPNKVPVLMFKSRTLPNGLDRSPFYSAAEDNSCPKSGHVSHENLLQLPPLPEDEMPKKKWFRFSRKDKKRKEDSSSSKSDLSFEEGFILRKVGALDGGTVLQDFVEDKDKNESGEEKKRQSLWSSFGK